MKKRKDGRYVVYVNTPDGRKAVYGRTKQEVNRKVKDLEEAVESGTYTTPSDGVMTVWLKEWTDNHLRNLKPQTIRTYKSNVKNYIKPYFLKMKIQNIDTADVQEFIYDLQDKGLSGKTVRNIYGTLHKSFSDLIRLRPKMLSRNPCEGVQLPKAGKPQLSYLPPENVDDFLKTCKADKYYEMFCFAVYSGMRQGELLALEWKNVDLDNGTVFVSRTQNLYAGDCDLYNDTTKNGEHRIVHIPSKLCTMMRRYKAEQNEYRLRLGSSYHNNGLVFANEIGEHFNGVNVSRHFRVCADNAGYQNVPFHGLRHTYAVLNIVAGVPEKVISENLGHKSVAFTMDKYAFVSRKMSYDASEKLDQLIGNI